MKIFPAIDLLGGKVVRLYQGDYGQKQEFGDDPLAFARAFEAAGAGCLHVVDLDGAKTGSPQNFEIVRRICAETGLFVEMGGGIRNAETVRCCFDAGAGRVILGTAALRSPEFAAEMAAQYGDGLAVGVDARSGFVAVEGWLTTSEVDSILFCKKMRDAGVQNIIYTDISKDGAEQGTNLAVYKRLAAIQGLHITAAGGVSSLEDIRKLRALGLYGAILGKALYTGAVKLEDALRTAKGEL